MTLSAAHTPASGTGSSSMLAKHAENHNPPPRMLWQHPDPSSTNMARFMRLVNQRRHLQLNNFRDLYEWSIGPRREDFWAEAFDYLPIIHSGRPVEIVERGVRMDHLPRWFRGVSVNFAENCLYAAAQRARSERSTVTKEDDRIAMTTVREGCTEIRQVSYGELRRRTARLASALKACGVRRGDRVAAVASHSLDTATLFYAVTALGAIFSSSSTDMGVPAILDRVLQINPKWVFADDWALYNGKTVDLRPKMKELVTHLNRLPAFKGLVSMPRWEKPADIGYVPNCQTLETFLTNATSDEPEFMRVDWSDPLIIAYSSGTTGQPKCITHCVGGILLSQFKEGILHRDFGPHTVIFNITSTAWIVHLASLAFILTGARTIVYDGSIFLPEPRRLVQLLSDEKVTNFVTSPRWFQTLADAGIAPREVADLSALKCVNSIGMILPTELAEWVYDIGFPKSIQLGDLAGGTDNAGSLTCDNPLEPVYAGGCQGPVLGTPLAIYDSSDDFVDGVSPPARGRRVKIGEAGELVVTDSYPNMPVTFWGEERASAGRLSQRYFDAYFARFDNIWSQGDFVLEHPLTKHIVYLGRSDGVLNPSGVRFGSAEIYNVVEKGFADRVMDSICVGQRRPQDKNETVVLFLKMQPNTPFTPALAEDIKAAIAQQRSKRHVPKYIFETPAIPTTLNFKKVELPVKRILSGQTVKPSSMLANPESLDFFYRFQDIQALLRRTCKL